MPHPQQSARPFDAKRTIRALAVLALALAALACGGSGDDSSGGGGGDSSAAGSGGTAASAGTGGTTGGAGTTAGAGGTAGSTTATGGGGTGGTAAMNVTCGTATCTSNLGFFARPCCVDEATSECGLMLSFGGSGTCNPMVDPDPRCESLMIMSFQIPSCCTADNKCGFDASMFGMAGCTSIEEAQMIRDMNAAMGAGDGGTADGGMPMGGTGGAGGGMGGFMLDITLPAPKACQ